jgi:thiosulfate/3-mercaptopyruvate sulfurtransferase
MKYPLLISPQWLYDNLNNSEIEIIENSWITDSYTKAHIKGAFSVPHHPHLKRNSANGERTQYVMEPVTFLNLCHNLGLKTDKHYVIYDDYYGFFVVCFWFVCRYFGLNNFSILDGSWKGWLELERPVSCRTETPDVGSNVLVTPQSYSIIEQLELEDNFANPEMQILDTRSEDEFIGVDARGNLRQGHIPGALHLEWTDILTEPEYDGASRFFKPLDEIAQIVSLLGLRRDKMVITYCQSGIRAAFCNFVLELLGFPNHRLYDASMGEWANHPSTPLSQGSN